MDSGAAALMIPIGEIVWINLLLSGDNAVVIALACRSLPPKQRRLGVALGASAAVSLRIIFTILVVELLTLPFVKIAGGALLLWIAVRLVSEETGEEIQPAKTISEAIRLIVIADAVMSLDNVMAIAAVAKGSNLLIFIGLSLSIPIVVLGSTLMVSLLARFPALVWAGAALLGWIAGNLIGSDLDLASWLGGRATTLLPWAPPAGVVLVLAGAWLRNRRKAAARRRESH